MCASSSGDDVMSSLGPTLAMDPKKEILSVIVFAIMAPPLTIFVGHSLILDM